MAFSRKRPGTTLGLVALIAVSLGIGYFWLHGRTGAEMSAGLAAAGYTSPCMVSDSPLPRPHGDANAGAKQATLKIASPAPQNSHYAERLIAAAREIREQTSGRVVIKLYFGGVQGDARTVLMKMRSGMLHGATFFAAELAERYPDIALYRLPFLFRDADEVAFVRKALDTVLHAGLAEAGLVSFCISSVGFSRFASTAPVRSRVDLLGRHTWVPEQDTIGYAFISKAGANPSPLPFGDVMTGLQTELLEIAPVTPIAAVTMQWHTRVDYLTRLPLQYQYWLLAVDHKTFSKIAPADQAVVRGVLDPVFQAFDSMAWKGETDALLALESSGIRTVDPDPEWAGALQKLGDEVAVQLIRDGNLSPELYDQARDLIEEYRESN